MVNMTLSIPDELHRKMKNFSEIKWSEIARRAIEERIKDLERLDKIASKSRLSKKDVLEISNRIKKNIAKKSN